MERQHGARPEDAQGYAEHHTIQKVRERYLQYVEKMKPGQFMFTRTGADLPISSAWFYDNIGNPAVDPLVKSGVHRRRSTARGQRHTHILMQIARGATIKAIQDHVGAEDFSTMANTYGHLESTTDMIAADSLEFYRHLSVPG